jgi:dolichyl-phosphate-mannose-protein mannosyltransferase
MIFATFLFALDDMFFVHASLGWLDIYMVTFMLLGFLLYLYEAYIPMGIAFALSTLCKFSGGLAILAVCLHWLLTRRNKKKQMIISIIITGLSFLLFMTLFQYLVQGILINPVQRTMVILRLTALRTFSPFPPNNLYDPMEYEIYNLQVIESTATRPWEWLLPHKIFSYSETTIQYLSFISWTIQILIIPAVIYMIYKAIRGNNAACFSVTWFTFTYLTWIPLVLITDRITYDFYFLPTTGAICIGIGMALSDMLDKLKANAIQQGKITTGAKIAYAGIAFYHFKSGTTGPVKTVVRTGYSVRNMYINISASLYYVIN